ncbi:MAG: class I SAM-dependent methyltransferase [Myxococcota bacterium]
MQEQDFSQTAFLVAGYRARATGFSDSICNDPWAGDLAGDFGEALCRQWDLHVPDAGRFLALRTRYIDDVVSAAIGRGIRQVVILGAGLDTRAARLGRDGVRFFEVDRPASQVAKQRGIANLPGYPRGAATYVACDFERDDFVSELERAGLDRSAPTLFVWEGVVYYLNESAARETLQKIASCFSPDSCVVFDYFDIEHNKRLVNDELRADLEAMQDLHDEVSEPPSNGLEPGAATALLHDTGFRFLRTVSFAELAIEHYASLESRFPFHLMWMTTASVGQHLTV